jgi:hypothetical protein
MSWGWVYRGFVQDWKLIVHVFRGNSLAIWTKFLWGQTIKIGWHFELKSPWIKFATLE